MKKRFSLYAYLLISVSASAQKSPPFYFTNKPIIADSASTVMLPVLYNVSSGSTDKMAYSGRYYANIIFYDYLTDSTHALFKENTYIKIFEQHRYSFYERPETPCFKTSKWIFYEVSNIDRNQSGQIDYFDPVILYVSDLHGNKLERITPENENLIEITIYDSLGIAMLKMQRDSKNDLDFDYRDRSYYYVELDRKTLTRGQPIETPVK